MQRDSRVDDYIAKAQPFARPILERLRDLMEEVVPEAHEDIKWGAPHWIVGGRNLAGMGAFKAHARFFLHGALSADEKTTWDRFGKLETVDDCPDAAELKRILEPRIVVLKSGNSLARSTPKTAIPMPEDFAAALSLNNGAQSVWDGFTNAQRRDYLEWITTAKREATRASRIATAAEWIGEGKRRNWKYENC